MKKNFAYEEFVIDTQTVLSVFDIQSLTPDIIQILDQYFVEICEGDSGSSLDTVKKSIWDLYDGKNDEWIMGATAEFFIHLYMKMAGYKQEFLFTNLEERSIKKGFDGFYSLNGVSWIMESKAGANTPTNTHKGKVLLAMKNLSDKVAGKDVSTNGKQNNPYRNAYNHASHIDVGTEKSIRNQIKKLRDDFTNGKYANIDDFNTMPCGTIFCGGIWSVPDHDTIKNSIASVANKLRGKSIHVICVTQNSMQIFLDYIK